jgi:hypothetical protein
LLKRRGACEKAGEEVHGSEYSCNVPSRELPKGKKLIEEVLACFLSQICSWWDGMWGADIIKRWGKDQRSL